MFRQTWTQYLTVFALSFSAPTSHACAWFLGAKAKVIPSPTLILDFDMAARDSDEVKKAVVVAASAGSHKPLFSPDQEEVVGRNVSSGKDVLFVIKGDRVKGLPLRSNLRDPAWKAPEQLGEGIYILASGKILEIDREDESDGGGYATNIATLDFDFRRVSEILDEKINAVSNEMKRLALSENRTFLLRQLLRGDMSMKDLSAHNIQFATSEKDLRMFAFIRTTNPFYNSNWSSLDLLVPIESTRSVGQAYQVIYHPHDYDRLRLEDGKFYSIDNGD